MAKKRKLVVWEGSRKHPLSFDDVRLGDKITLRSWDGTKVTGKVNLTWGSPGWDKRITFHGVAGYITRIERKLA